MLSKKFKMSQPHTKKPPTAGPPPEKEIAVTNSVIAANAGSIIYKTEI
jgi:hypothetical protein